MDSLKEREVFLNKKGFSLAILSVILIGIIFLGVFFYFGLGSLTGEVVYENIFGNFFEKSEVGVTGNIIVTPLDSRDIFVEEVNKITASDGESNDRFGRSVSISEDYAIVGSVYDDDKGTDSGSAYIFKKNSTGQFEFVNKITASDGVTYHSFGFSVSISGDYAVVGTSGGGVMGDYRGSAYIFKKNSTGQFEEINKITASDSADYDFFGSSVSISGDYALIGAYGDDDKGEYSGSVYIFKKNSTGQFEEINKITASDGVGGGYFGSSVSISEDYAIVAGSSWDDNNKKYVRSAYIFKKNSSGQFEEVNKITSSDGEEEDYFGSSVSISGDHAIIGAYGDDDKGTDSGSAYIFKKNSTGQFEEVNKITSSDGEEEDYFGLSVSISGDYAIVGSYYDDDNGEYSGSAYIFKKNFTGQFEEINKITASDGEEQDLFGHPVSISGDYAIVGSYYDDDKGFQSGSVYIYELVNVPRIKILSPIRDTAYVSVEEINYSVSGEGLDSCWYSFDSGNTNSSAVIAGNPFTGLNLSSGKYNLTVYCNNSHGDIGREDISFFVFERGLSKITASDGERLDFFGRSVSISGDYAIVGVEGDDDKGNSSGAAYIFKKNSYDQFEEVNKITASDGEMSDYFGNSVSISGDYAIVGSEWDDYNGENVGSAYIFKKNSSGNFEELQKLNLTEGEEYSYFGHSVSISGDYAIVASKSLSVFALVFKKNSYGQFEEVDKLVPTDRINLFISFGDSVSISGDYAIVGAPRDVNNGIRGGSAYIFKKNSSGQFEEVNKLTVSDGESDDLFGHSVSISGDYAIVGVEGDDDKGSSSGSAYIFKKNSSGQFEFVNKITASDGESNDRFGRSVSISEDYAIVGSVYDDDKGTDSGSAYIFKKNSTGQFEFVNKITAIDGAQDDSFGGSVSISGDYAIIGVYQDDDKGYNSGLAYIYNLPPCVHSLKNTSVSSWTNLSCVSGKMNQSQNWTEYDENNCGDFENKVYYNYQLVGPVYTNSSWLNLNEGICVGNNLNKSMYLTSLDEYGCGEDITYYKYNLTLADLQYGDWTEWENVGSCSSSGKQNQSRERIQYDKNNLGCFTNVSNVEYQEIDCSSCTVSLENNSWSQWEDVGCSNSNLNQSRFLLEYDKNNCNETEDKFYYEYQLLSPNYTNDTWGEWISLSCVEETNYYAQTRNLNSYDVNGCANNITYTEYRDNVVPCDCAENLVNSSKSNWINISCLKTNLMNQSRMWIEYDEKSCGTFQNRTYYESQAIEYCNYSAINCIENWSCTDWGSCVGGSRSRTCSDLHSCGTEINKSSESLSCSDPSNSGSTRTASKSNVIVLDFNSSFVKKSNNLNKKDKISFYIPGPSSHLLEFNSVSGKKAYFTLKNSSNSSDVVVFNLGANEEKYLDLDNDNQDDFYVRLESVSSDKILVSTQAIKLDYSTSEEYVDVDDYEEEEEFSEPTLEETTSDFSFRNILFIIAIFILSVGILVILYFLIFLFIKNRKEALREELKKLIEEGNSFVSSGNLIEARSSYEKARKIFEDNKEDFRDLFSSLMELYGKLAR